MRKSILLPALAIVAILAGCKKTDAGALESVKERAVDAIEDYAKQHSNASIVSGYIVDSCVIDTITFAQAQEIIHKADSVAKAELFPDINDNGGLPDKAKAYAKKGKGNDICFVTATVKERIFSKVVNDSVKSKVVYYMDKSLNVIDSKNVTDFGDMMNQMSKWGSDKK